MSTTKPIPFHIELRRLFRGGESREDSLKLGVVGVEKPAAFIIASDLYSRPRIVQHDSHGDLNLHDDLIDALAIHCFNLMASAISDGDGESGWWTIPDISTFIRIHFSYKEAAEITTELARHASDGPPVTSVCMVVNDDDALDAVPFPLPI